MADISEESKQNLLNWTIDQLPDPKKISATENHFRLRVGDYRILITLRDNPNTHCYVLAVKRRTSTTYLHEEKATYGCSAN